MPWGLGRTACCLMGWDSGPGESSQGIREVAGAGRQRRFLEASWVRICMLWEEGLPGNRINYQGSQASRLISLLTPQQVILLREFPPREENPAHTLFLGVKFPDFSVIALPVFYKLHKWLGGWWDVGNDLFLCTLMMHAHVWRSTVFQLTFF